MQYDPLRKKYLLCGDMHIHTNYSDGAALEEVLCAAVNADLDFIAVTDHDNFEGSLAMQNLVREMNLPLIVIPGIEISGPGCHLLAYNIKENPYAHGSVREICRQVREAGGLVSAAHPCWDCSRKVVWESGLFQELIAENAVDAFELMNGGGSEEIIGNLPVADFYRKLQGKGISFAVTAGSDAHKSSNVGRARLAVWTDAPDAESLCRAIFRDHSAGAWMNGNFTAKPDWFIPEILSHTPAPELLAETSFDPERGSSIRLTSALKPSKIYLPDALSLSDDTLGLSLREQKLPFSAPAVAEYDLECGKKRSSLVLHLPPALSIQILPQLQKEKTAVVLKTKNLLSKGIPPHTVSITENSGEKTDLSFPALPPGVEKEVCLDSVELDPDGGKNIFICSAATEKGIVLAEETVKYPILSCPENEWSKPVPLSDTILDSVSDEVQNANALFRVSYDRGSLKLEFILEKKHFFQEYHGMSMYMGDCFQFGIDPYLHRSHFNLQTKDVWELQFSKTASGAELYVTCAPEGLPKPDLKDLPCSAEEVSLGKMVFRMTFPWKTLGIRPEKGLRIGFNAIFNLNDGKSRCGALQWTRGIYDRKCAFDWGILMLR